MKKYSFGAIAILAIAAVIAIASGWHDSPIVDEDPHIGAGYSYIAGHTYEFNPEHPPLAKDLAGIALSFLHINPKIIPKTEASVNDQWNFGRTLIYHSGVDPITIVHVARLPLIIFFLLSGWLVFLWARRTYNPRTALLAVFLFALSPTVVAHARFVTTDVPALFGVLLASYFYIRYLGAQSTKNFWIAALAFGIAMLTKFSMFLLIPYLLLAGMFWAWSHHQNYLRSVGRIIWKTILIMIVGFIVVVGPIYQFHVYNYPPSQQIADEQSILNGYQVPAFAHAIIWASDKPVLRPYAQWMLGMAMVFQRAEGGNRTYFLGQVSSASFKAYFPVVFALKEPIPFLLLIIGSIYLAWEALRRKHLSIKNKIREHFPALMMLLWVAIYVASSITARLNIGIRHLMPIYGFLFVLVAGQIEPLLSSPKKWLKYIVIGLLGWYALEFAAIYPYYLTYFNEFAGGPSGGHNYVVDSNLDWGQDLWRLADYVKANHISKLSLDYFGWADPSFYLGTAFNWIHGGQYINKAQFLRDNPNGGWIAVSGTYYEESTVDSAKPYAWLGKPTTVIGNSIFVWHVVP